MTLNEYAAACHEAKDIAEAAEREAEAQLAIVRVLKPLAHEKRKQVLAAAVHIVAADRLVPGIVAMLEAKALDSS